MNKYDSDGVFRHKIDIQIRFTDVDLLGHINNNAYLNYYDLGKIKYFEEVYKREVDWAESELIVANVNTDFLLPIYYRDRIYVQTRIERIGNKSLTLYQEIVDKNTNEVRSRCHTVMVAYDLKNKVSKPIPDDWRILIEAYQSKID